MKRWIAILGLLFIAVAMWAMGSAVVESVVVGKEYRAERDDLVYRYSFGVDINNGEAKGTWHWVTEHTPERWIVVYEETRENRDGKRWTQRLEAYVPREAWESYRIGERYPRAEAERKT